MSEDNEQFKPKVLEENILEPTTFDLTITVHPVIYSQIFQEGDEPTWFCSFKVRSGGDRAIFFSTMAYGSHYGERRGQHWEETKRMWQKQYDFIRQYLGFVMLWAGETLVGEAALAEGYSVQGYRGNWDALGKEVFEAVTSVFGQYMERADRARQEEDWEALKVNEASWRAVMIVCEAVSTILAPLQGTAFVNAGRKSILRYNIPSMEKLHACEKVYRDVWAQAGAECVRWKRQIDRGLASMTWEQIKYEIRQACKKTCPDYVSELPDGLLDELRKPKPQWRYELRHLAIVHAARDCQIFLAGPSWPQANNYKIIDTALREYRQSIGESEEVEK